MHCVSDEEFVVFKERAMGVVKNHLDKLDEHIQRSIELINRIPGVATVFCCSGHTTEGGASTKNVSGYIMLVTTDLKMVYPIYNNILSLTENNKDNEFLRATSLSWKLSMVRKRRPWDGVWYNSVIIEYPKREVSQSELELLNRVVQTAIGMTLVELNKI